MIKTFKNKALRNFFVKNDAKGINKKLAEKISEQLHAIDAATNVWQLDIPGWRLHKHKGYTVRWSVDVNGPWRITFNWEGADAFDLDLEQYH